MTTLTVRPKNKKELLAIKTVLEGFKVSFETSQEEDTSYNAKFVERVLLADKEIDEGKGVKIALEDLWK
jgi:hypothetical protein